MRGVKLNVLPSRDKRLDTTEFYTTETQWEDWIHTISWTNIVNTVELSRDWHLIPDQENWSYVMSLHYVKITGKLNLVQGKENSS